MHSTLALLELIWRPHPGQLQFLTETAKFRELACGRRWGKSDACAVQLLDGLLGSKPMRALLLAPTAAQASLIFDRLVDLTEQVGLGNPKAKRTPYPRLTLGAHKVIARSGKTGNYLRGLEATDIIIDEAAFVAEETITQVALPMLATTGGRLTLVSTPQGMNHFWRFYEQGRAGQHGISCQHGPTSQNPLVSPEFLEIQRGLVSERVYRVEYEAEFINSNGRIFRAEMLDRCVVPRIDRRADDLVVIGVDWAKYSDSTAVVVCAGSREACRILEASAWNLLSWQEQLQRVHDIVERYPGARVICDATGVGDPLLETLQTKCERHAPEGVVFTAPEKQRMIESLAWMVEQGHLKTEPHPELMKQLLHFEGKVTRAGNVRLGAASGYHDDLVIALALATSRMPQPYNLRVQMGSERKFSRNPQGESA